MAIAYQGSADLGNNSGSSNSLTASYTVNAASNLLVVGFLGDLTSGNDDITGVTYNGVSMTLAKKYGPTESPVIRNQYIYFLVNPATGANNVVISSTNTKYIIAVAADYSGAATSGQPDATANAETGATASTITASVITVANNAWAVALSQGYSNGGAPTAGSGADLRTYGSAFGQPGWFDSNGAITPAGSYSMTLNQPSSVQSIAATLVSFAPALSAASGSLAVTMPDLTLAGTATVPVAATLAKTMPAFTLSGTATIPVGATLAVTMPNFTLAGTGTIITAATLAKTIADLTLAGTATVSGGVVSGSLAATMPNFTLVGTAGVISAGSLAATIPSFTLVGTAQVLSVVTAALAATFPAFILTATATVGKAPVPPPPDGVSNFIMQGLLLGTIVTDEPIAAGAYKVSVSARWNQGSKITIGTINGPAYSWTNNSRRGVAFPLGQLVVTVQNATSVKIVISPS